ncbi:metal-sensitive transcriptional regulator [Sanguibacter sp. 25GB23B1]|uniref:metal-sensitive transcriptional regulator n=1 Tax=unclassified Sanguibacter TaxID=2645534 RepID=UPI0032AFD364
MTDAARPAAPPAGLPAPLPDDEARRKILNRLRRAHGQLAAVIAAVEDDVHCRDVVQQLAAVTKALDKAGFLVISTALKECLTDPDADGVTSPVELEKLFLSLA